MKWPTDLPSEPVGLAFLAANTPAYLFKRLRSLDIVQRLAETTAPDQLIAMYLANAADPDRSQTGVARAYAALAALSLKPYSEWRSRLPEVNWALLQWGEHFRSLMVSSASAESSVSVRVRTPSVRVAQPEADANTSSVQIHALPPRGRVTC
jgi:hypothetical protein